MNITSQVQEKEAQQPVAETETPVPFSTTQTIDVYVKEAIDRFDQLADKKKTLLKELARKISELPGVQKNKVAQMIVISFTKLGHPEEKRYIYRTLDKEYKNERLSDAATESNEIRKQAGWDNKQKKIVLVEDYNIESVTSADGVGYSFSTLVRIVVFLDNEKKRLMNENAELKAQIAELSKKS